MVPKLAEKGLELSYRTISRHLGGLGYKNNVPVTTPMLTNEYELNGLMLTLMITGRNPFSQMKLHFSYFGIP